MLAGGNIGRGVLATMTRTRSTGTPATCPGTPPTWPVTPDSNSNSGSSTSSSITIPVGAGMVEPDARVHEVLARTAVVNTRNPRLVIALIVFVALTVVGATILFVLFLGQRARTADLTGQVDTLSGQIATLGPQVNRQHDDAEALARQVKALGAAPVVQPQPVVGPVGPAGRGISGTALRDGHLILMFTDGTTADVGQITGTPGAAGTAGTSITSALVVGGHLVLTYSDGHTADVGQVVGPAGAAGAAGKNGRSVTSVTNSGGHLIVGYSDGTTQDAGPLPAGPAGPAGPTGATGATGRPPGSFSFTDELGRTYTCTPDTAADPGASPHYSCTATTTSSGTGTGHGGQG